MLRKRISRKESDTVARLKSTKRRSLKKSPKKTSSSLYEQSCKAQSIREDLALKWSHMNLSPTRQISSSKHFSVPRRYNPRRRVTKSQLEQSSWTGHSTVTQTLSLATQVNHMHFLRSKWCSLTPRLPGETLPLAVVTRTCKQRPTNTTESWSICSKQVQNSGHSSRPSSTGREMSNQP